MLRQRTKPGDPKPNEKKKFDERWLITDFITLGSPLAHAPFLLASDVADFETRKETREYPTSPPIREHLTKKLLTQAQTDAMPLSDPPKLLSFHFDPDNWQLHHATPFAAVRWTNIHDPSRLIYCGDVVSGPISPIFGPGVIDIDLSKLRGRSWLFTHTKYWTPDRRNGPGKHIDALRAALDLAGDRL